MVDYLRKLFAGQYDASLCMLNDAIKACPDEHWERNIANGPIRWAAYHTLYFADLYLTRSAAEFTLRDVHHEGGDEGGPAAARGLERSPTLNYLQICRDKVPVSLSAETRESFEGPSGFQWYAVTRGEMHMINIRHIQHHAAQIHAYLRRERIVAELRSKQLRWIGSGWRD